MGKKVKDTNTSKNSGSSVEQKAELFEDLLNPDTNPQMEGDTPPPPEKDLELFSGKQSAFGDTTYSNMKINLEEYAPYFGNHVTTINPETMDRERARRQSGLEQLGNSMIKLLPHIGYEVINQAGAMLDLEDYVQTDNEVGNWLSDWATSKIENLQEEFPIYRVNPETSFDIRDSGWWYQRGEGIVASAAAFGILGYATGGIASGVLGGAGKVASALSRSARASRRAKSVKWLSSLSKNTATATQRTGGIRELAGLANSYLLTHAEGIGVATDVYNQAYNTKLEDLTLEGIAEEDAVEQAKQYAAERASIAYNTNKANFLLNITSASAFISPQLLTRSILKKSTAKSAAKKILGESVQEGVEEQVNLLAEKQGLDENYTITKAMEDALSVEGLESFVLGAVGGAGQTAITGLGKRIKLGKDENGNRVSRKDKERKIMAKQQAIMEQNAEILGENTLQATDAFNSSKEVLDNINKIAELQIKLENDTLSEIERDSLEKEVETLNKINLFKQAETNFKNGTTENLLSTFEDISKLTPEEAEKRQLPKNYKEKALEAVKLVEQLENSYIESAKYANQPVVYDNRSTLVLTNNLIEQTNKNLTKAKEGFLELLQEQSIGSLTDIGVDFDNGNVTYDFDYDRFKSKDKTQEASDIKNKLKNDIRFENYVKALTELEGYTRIKKGINEEYNQITSAEEQKAHKQIIKAFKEAAKKEGEKRKAQEEKVKKKEKSRDKKEGIKSRLLNKTKSTLFPKSADEVEIIKENKEDTKKKEDNDGQNNENSASTSNTNDNNRSNVTSNTTSTVEKGKETSTTDSTKKTKATKKKEVKGATLTPEQNSGTTAKPPKISKMTSKFKVGNKNINDVIGVRNPKDIDTAITFLQGQLKLATTPEILDQFIMMATNTGKATEQEILDYAEQVKEKVPNIIEYLEFYKNNPNYDKKNKEVKEAIEGTEEEKESEDGVGVPKVTKEKIEALARSIEEDLSPVDEEDNVDPTTEDNNEIAKRQNAVLKSRERLNLLSSILEDFVMQGIDPSNFPDIARKFASVLGEDRFFPLFETIQNLWNTTGLGEQNKDTILEIFNSEGAKTFVKLSEDLANRLPDGVYTNDDEVYVKESREDINEDLFRDSNLNPNLEYKVDPTERRVEQGNNILAYLARDYNYKFVDNEDGTVIVSREDADNNLRDIPIEILDPSIITPGKSISFVALEEVQLENGNILRKNGNEYDVEGNLVKEGSPIENAPIGVLFENKLIEGLFLHQPSWITHTTVYGNIEEDRKNLRNFRKEVLDRNKPVTVKVNKKSNGSLILNKEGYVSSSKSIPHIDTFMIGKGGTFMTSLHSSEEVINKALPRKGVVYAKVDLHNGKYIAVPLSRNRISKKYSESIVKALDIYLLGEESDLYTQILETYGIDLHSFDDLKTYITNFVHVISEYSDKVDEMLVDKNEGVRIFNMIKLTSDKDVNFNVNKIEVGSGQNIGRHSFTKEDFQNLAKKDPAKALQHKEAFLNAIRNHLKGMYVNININSLNSNLQIPILKKDGSFEAIDSSYSDFIKDNTTTNLMSVTLENGKVINTIQQVIQYDTDIRKIKTEDTTSEGKEIEDTESSTSKPKPKTISKGGFSIKIDLNEDLDGDSIDAAPLDLEDSFATEISSNIPDTLLISGIPFNFQQLIVENIINKVLGKLTSNPKEITYQEDLDNFKGLLENVVDAYEEAGATKNAEFIQKIVDNFNKIENLVKFKLDGESFVKESKDVFINEDTDEEETILENRYWDDNTATIDLKTTTSVKTKLMMSGLSEATNEYEEIQLPNGETVVQPIKRTGQLGLTSPLTYNQVYAEVKSLLATSNAKYVNPSFEDMISILEDNIESKPYLYFLLNDSYTRDGELDRKGIKSLGQDFKNAFVKDMSSTYTHHESAIKTPSGKFYFKEDDSSSKVKKLHSTWKNELLTSPILTLDTDEGVYTVGNKDYVKQIFKDIKEKLVNKTITVNDVLDYLSVFGITLERDYAIRLMNTGLYVDGKFRNFPSLFTLDTGVFKLLHDKFVNHEGSIQEDNPLNDTVISTLAYENAKYIRSAFANSGRSINNKQYYWYGLNRFFTDRFMQLKTDEKLLNQLDKDPFSRYSKFLNYLTKRVDGKLVVNEDAAFYKHFEYNTVGGIKINNKGKTLDEVTPSELEYFTLQQFLNQGVQVNLQGSKSGKVRKAKLLFSTMSDKSNLFQVTTLINNLPVKNGRIILPKVGNLRNKIYEEFALPEVSRMLAYKDNPNVNIKGYDKGANIFYIIPELNNIEGIWENGDRNNGINPDIKDDVNLQNKVVDAIINHIESLAEQKRDTWRDLNFVSKANGVEVVTIGGERFNKTNRNDLDYLSINYVYNTLLAEVNFKQLFSGDIASYYKGKGKNVLDDIKSTFNNMGKRLAAENAPGSDYDWGKNATVNYAFLQDFETSSEYIEEYTDKIGELANPYSKIQSTDAQEFVTLEEHLLLLSKEGLITENKMEELLKKDNNYRLTEKDAKIILQPTKPRYVNNVERDGVITRLYIKSSAFPLAKTLTKGLEIDKLRAAMEDTKDESGNPIKVNRVAFSTAVKVGNVKNPVKVFENDGTISNDFKFKVEDVQTVPREGFKIQQPVPYDPTKVKINDGTQQSKLLFADILEEVFGEESGKQLYERYINLYEDSFKLKYNTFIKSYTKDNVLDIPKIHERIIQEAKDRNYSLKDITYLNLITNNKGKKEFENQLWASPIASKIESLLTSIVDNDIRKRKVAGRSFVLTTEAGFKVDNGVQKVENISELGNPTNFGLDKTWYQETKGKLRPMREEDGVIKPAEVLIKPKVKLQNGEFLSYNELVDAETGYIKDNVSEDVLKLFGFRIPTQGLKSMSYMKVVGFLPDSYGDVMVAPKEFVTQMGSDFDIDKIYTNMYHFTKDEDGNIVKYTSDNKSLETIENDILDIHFKVLTNPSKNVQSRIITPLLFGRLPYLLEKYNKMKEDSTVFSGLSDIYQKEKYLQARIGKKAVGTFSLDSVFNSLTQTIDKPMYFYKMVKEDGKMVEVPDNITFGNLTSNDFTVNTTNNPDSNRYKSDVIEAFQSAAVDNESEQILGALHINEYTIDVIRALAMTGFEEDLIIAFINQPIIKEYVQLKDRLSNPLLKENFDPIERLYKKYETGSTEKTIEKLSSPSLETLEKNVATPNINSTLFKDGQKAILNKFIDLVSKGKNIQIIQSTINADSKGVGKDLFYVNEKINQVFKLPSVFGIKNSEALLGDYKSISDIEGLEDKRVKAKILEDQGYINIDNNTFIKPTSINGLATIYATITTGKIFNRLFPYDNYAVNQVFSLVKQHIGIDEFGVARNADENRRIWNEMKAYIAAFASPKLFSGTLREERVRLNTFNKTNTSLSRILLDVQKTKLGSNPFISRLTATIDPLGLDTVEYDASTGEDGDEDLIFQGFNSLLQENKKIGTYNGIEYTTRTLAQDLISYLYINKGIQSSRNYIKYVALSYLSKLGYTSTVNNTNFSKMFDIGAENNTINSFIKQFIQHNPGEVSQTVNEETIQYSKDKGSFIVKSGDFFKDLNPSKGGLFKDMPYLFLSIYEKGKNGKKGKYRLYQRVSADTYKEIDTLGFKDIKEYSPGEENAQSLAHINRAKTGEAFRGVTTKEDIKNYKKTPPKKDTKTDSPVVVKGNSLVPLNKKVTDILTRNDRSSNKIKDLLNTLKESDLTDFQKYVVDRMLLNLDKVPDINVQVIYSGASGRVISDLETGIPKTFQLNVTLSDKKLATTAIHELTHLFTKNAIKKGDNTQLRGYLNLAKDKLKSMYPDTSLEEVLNKVKKGTPLTKEEKLVYYTKNIEEFTAGVIENKEFQELLNTVKVEGNQTLLDKVLNFIAEITAKLGLQSDDTLLVKSLAETLNLIDTPILTDADVQNGSQLTMPTVKSIDSINKHFGIEVDGIVYPLDNAHEIADFINANTDNVIAEVYDNYYISLSNKVTLKGDKTGEGTDTEIGVPPEGKTKQQQNPLRPYNSTAESPIEIYVDGSDIKGTGDIGYGAYTEYNGKAYELSGTNTDPAVTELSKLFPDAAFSNPTMEMLGLLKTLEQFEDKGEHIVINQDYKGAVNYGKLWNYSEGSGQRANKAWKPKKDYIKHIVKEIEQVIEKIESNGGSVKLNWVKGHSNNRLNDEADRVAKSRENYNTFINSANTNDTPTQLSLFGEDLSPIDEDEDEELLTPSEVKYKETKRHLIHNRKALLNNLNSQLALEKSNKNYNKVVHLKKRIETTEEQIEYITATSYLSTILPIAKEDIDILESLLSDDMTIKDIEYAHSVIDLWVNSYEVFFDEESKTSETLSKEFGDIAHKMSDFRARLYDIRKNRAKDLVHDTIGDYAPDFSPNTKDITKYASNSHDISRHNNPLLSTMYKKRQLAQMAAKRESDEILKIADKHIKEVVPELKRINDKHGFKSLFEVYRQTYDDGRYTGNQVNPFSVEYYEKVAYEYYKVKNSDDRSTAYEDFLDFKKENVHTFDIDILFPLRKDSKSDTKRDEYINKLSNEVGEGLASLFLEQQEQKLKEYNDTKASFEQELLIKYSAETIKDLVSSNEEAKDEYFIWLIKNSPYEFIRSLKKGRPLQYKGALYNSKGFEYILEIPKKTKSIVEKGVRKEVKTNYYDSKFDIIYSNPKLFEFYKFMTNTFEELSTYLPSSEQEKVKYNAFPSIKRSFMEMFKDEGFNGTGTVIYDNLIKSIRTEDLSTVSNTDQEFSTNKDLNTLQVNFLTDIKTKIKNEIQVRTIDYKLSNNTDEVPDDVKKEWKRELVDKYAKDQSYDLGKVIKAYSMLVLAHKHKVRVESEINLINNLIQEQQEYKRNSLGEVIRDTNDNNRVKYVENKDALKNLKEAANYFVQATMYDNSRVVEGTMNKKVYTKEESQKKKDIERLIERVSQSNLTSDQKEVQLRLLNKQLNLLGGKVAASKIGDETLRYAQLRGMGWNLLGAVSNLGFGILANTLMAQDSRIISKASFAKGYKLSLNSVIRNAAFNADFATSNTALKIRTLMDKLDVLKDSSHEMFKETAEDKLSKKGKFLLPYNLSQRTEYLNQAPIMIAMLMDAKHTLEDGTEVSLWDGYAEKGTWDEEKYGKEPIELLDKTNLKINQVIKMTHGNYDPLSPLMIKKKVAGRMLTQFRTWMFEGIASRFEGSKTDHILEIEIKGRYRSIPEYFKANGGIGSMYALLKDMTTMISPFHKTDLMRNGLSEVDAINMKRNLMELWMYLGITASIYMLSALAGDLDDDEVYFINHIINQLNRLQTDITFYMSPEEFRKLVKDPFPVVSLIKDSYSIIDHTAKTLTGNGKIKSGVNAGDYGLINSILKFLPFGSTILRLESSGKQVFDK